MSKTNRIKIVILLLFTGLAGIGFLKINRFAHTANAFSSGPPAGVSGAPNETTCAVCHSEAIPGVGQFTITAPQSYTTGQTYQITVRHTTADTTRLRWGFQLTSLAGNTFAGSFANSSGNTQIIDGGNGRSYIQQTLTGSFGGQTGGSVWTFNWTAPATNVGAVTLYAAGNQANNDGGTEGDRILTASATIQPSAATDLPVFDFDGDGKTDIGIFRPTPAEWWYLRSSDGSNRALQFGQTSDKLAPADYTGDGKTDIAFWRPATGQWFILRSEDNSFFALPFGINGDIPAPADFDGDGKADQAVFRPSNRTWFINKSSGGTTITQFGVTGDVPAVADYDGDGMADIAIFRPAPGEWWINRSSAGLLAFRFGSSSDKLTQGDYTGDGKADAAIWRPSTGQWFVLRSENMTFFAAPFGTTGDVPAPGDYDGDGKFDFAVFRPSASTWFVQRSTQGTLITPFGINGDIPVQTAYIP